jgi:hypothetical protein
MWLVNATPKAELSFDCGFGFGLLGLLVRYDCGYGEQLKYCYIAMARCENAKQRYGYLRV